MIEQPVLVPVVGKNQLYRLEKKFQIWLPVTGRWLIVDAGSVFDGASIPWILRPVLGSPFDPNYMAPAFVHDMLCHSAVVSRSVADKEFAELLKVNSPESAKVSFPFWIGVRIGALCGVGCPTKEEIARNQKVVRLL